MQHEIFPTFGLSIILLHKKKAKLLQPRAISCRKKCIFPDPAYRAPQRPLAKLKGMRWGGRGEMEKEKRKTWERRADKGRKNGGRKKHPFSNAQLHRLVDRWASVCASVCQFVYYKSMIL